MKLLAEDGDRAKPRFGSSALKELGWVSSRVTLEHDTNAALLAEAELNESSPSETVQFYCSGL